jgi:uncharacterized membrane protein
LEDRSKDIDQLSRKLNILISKQDVLSKEIEEIKSALEIFRKEESEESLKQEKEIPKTPKKVILQEVEVPKEPKSDDVKLKESETSGIKSKSTTFFQIPESVRTNLEDFIGTNLINKIGIVILIIGIGIGTKFAIDRNLISPLVRLILGYFLGSALLFFSYRLKKNYHNFSAVLCSGSMAILYFMTYAGIIYFDLISLTVAFTIMVAITVFTVYQAFEYNREVISIIGLVGAYAIPFLIGDDPEGYIFLFSYIAIINTGILIVTIKKYWKLLFYFAFAATWAIYAVWWNEADFMDMVPFRSAILFSSIFFVLFYCSFLLNRVLKNIKFSAEDIILILTNAFIFYGMGYVIIDTEPWRGALGLFTLINAGIHFLVWLIIYYKRGKDEKLLKLLIGLAITFITISIPVQFDGYLVTILWFVEGMILFSLGRIKKIPFYEYTSYPAIILGTFSLLDDWKIAYNEFGTVEYQQVYHPFININFNAGILVIFCLILVNYLLYHPKYSYKQDLDPAFRNLIQICLSGILIFVIYFTFRLEIVIPFNQLYADSISLPFSGDDSNLSEIRDKNILNLKMMWILIYSMIFFSLITLGTILKIKNEKMANFCLAANGMVLFIFLAHGLWIVSDLRDSYLNPEYPAKFLPGSENIMVRYIGILVFAYVVVLSYWLIRQKFIKADLKMYLDLFSSLALLWILSSELFHWLDFGDYKSADKLGLSILWGLFSLQLIIIGIWKKLKYLRVGAIILFGITLIKLSVYDIQGMDTISKTIVFISLGILLLIISFLYNKYRKIIF